MLRKAFLMFLNPGARDEYRRRHDQLWPDLEAVLIDHGVRSYSIYFDAERDLLFGYVELESQARWDAIAGTEPCRRWWTHMRDLMRTNPDHSPVSQELEEVFHLRQPSAASGKS